MPFIDSQFSPTMNLEIIYLAFNNLNLFPTFYRLLAYKLLHTIDVDVFPGTQEISCFLADQFPARLHRKEGAGVNEPLSVRPFSKI